MRLYSTFIPLALSIVCQGILVSTSARADSGSLEGQWHSWRGPLQTGASIESYEESRLNEEPVWTYEAYGRGTPIVVGGVLYSYAYRHGETPTVRDENKVYDYLPEVLLALDPVSGKKLWERQFPDYISDTVYNRYGTGAPSYDAETGNFYIMMSNGHLACVDGEGGLVWEISMIEEYGSLTFPNGRTGVPIVDGDLVIAHRVTTNWGAHGPALDRFYAFDKHTGEHVWASSPGVAPQDSSFSTPYLETRNGQRIMYVGTGCGNLVAINVLTGQPLWRYQMCHGGINSSPVVWKDRIIAVHGVENLDSSEEGRMVAIRIPETVIGPEDEEVVLGKECEIWRLPAVNSFSSSTVLLGDRAYQVTKTGSLACIDPDKGELLWEEKLGTDNLGHASPTAVNGLLIVPLLDGNVFVIKPTDEKGEILHKLDLDGACNGAPAVAGGKVFIETTEKLYCFAFHTGTITYDTVPRDEPVKPGKPVALQAVPSEVLLLPGEKHQVKLYSIDANGVRVREIADATWAHFVPPTARVKSEMDAGFRDGMIEAKGDARESAGAFKATSGGLSTVIRGRVLRDIPFDEDFEAAVLSEDHPTDSVKFAYPPLPWIGARFKWEIRDLDGNRVLAKTLDRVLFQRSITFIGHPESSNYTIQADVMTDGNRRIKSSVGLVNQRYIASLEGNRNLLEVTSNHERLKVAVPFNVSANKWYTMKMRVDVDARGDGVIRAKVWDQGGVEPEIWTIEVPHADAHKKGAPGVFGFAPQSQRRIYIDNIRVTQEN